MGMMPWGGWAGPLSTQPVTPTTNAVSFAADVVPVFTARCVICHGGVQDLWLDDYDDVIRGGASGPAVVPGDPDGSRLVQYVASGYMPYGGPPLSPAEVQLLVDWVAAGAPNS